MFLIVSCYFDCFKCFLGSQATAIAKIAAMIAPGPMYLRYTFLNNTIRGRVGTLEVFDSNFEPVEETAGQEIPNK